MRVEKKTKHLHIEFIGTSHNSEQTAVSLFTHHIAQPTYIDFHQRKATKFQFSSGLRRKFDFIALRKVNNCFF